MNVGVIGRNVEDIKLLLDLKILSKNNYYYVYNENNNILIDIIQYLINKYNVKIIFILDNSVDIKKVQLNFNNILLFNYYNIIMKYTEKLNICKNLIILNNKKINGLNTLLIDDELLNKKESLILKELNNKVKNITYKYDYICSMNSKLDSILSKLNVNIKIIKLELILKYILDKYNNENIDDNYLYVYTTNNKVNLKDKLIELYNINLDINFINPTSNYLINIDNFSGPLDLLLKLIKESNLNIYDINICDITDQYLSYIKKMEELNINIASSYLVMASELMYLKSKELLPKKELDNNIDEEELTREDLINKLIEYKKYKEITQSFKDMEEDASKYFMKLPTKIDVKDDNMDIDNNLEDLITAFNKFIQRKIEDEPLKTTITRKEYSVKERCNSIKNILKKKKKINFRDLFDIKSTSYIIVSFLSILELLKNGDIYLIQNNIFDNIIIGIRDDNNE